MPTTRFCGLSVRDFKGGIGWGRNSKSYLQVNMVQDTSHGDFPFPPPLGWPVYFQFYDFRFFGLLQKWSKKQDVNGLPTFEAVCEDPRDVLDGAEVIIGAYNGATAGLPNLLNAYGWWEQNFGFGSSGANGEGMPWYAILAAVTSICNTPADGPFGGPFNYRGVRYGLDLSALPVPPPDYRVAGNGASVNLLELIAQICEDGGCDFYVELDGFNLAVRTVSRVAQPPLGTIAALTSNNFGGTLIRSEDGLETRNELTSTFLVGGAVTGMHVTDTYASFWGYDAVGQPIVGTPGVFYLLADPALGPVGSNVVGLQPCEFMYLNATGVEDILGTTAYPCSTLELRFARVNQESWQAFIQGQRPDVAPLVFSPFRLNPGQAGALLKPDLVNDQQFNAQQTAKNSIDTDYNARLLRLYDFVKSYADEYLGRKFLVSLPFVLERQDNETFKIDFSQEIADAGWIPEGNSPLGVSPLNQDFFKAPDGRFTAFTKFYGLNRVDLGAVPKGTYVIEGNSLYMKCAVEPSMVFTADGYPCALVTLNGPVFEMAVDPLGDINLLSQIFGLFGADQLKPAVKNGYLSAKVHPNPVYPTVLTVPLKSNLLTYGPWYVAGAPGKTRCEYDTGLVPWNYGGEGPMELAALARVTTAMTNMQVSEAGFVELAGPPTISLGSVLALGGPNLTNIDVSYGTQGVTTTYRFQSFTPKFRVFDKGAADKIRKAGLVGQEMRRSLRQSINENISKAETVQSARGGFLVNASRSIKRETPHDTFVAYKTTDVDGSVRVMLSTATYEEAVGLSNADDDDEFGNTAVASLTSVLRPFSCTQLDGSLIAPLGNVAPEFFGGLNNIRLNPLQSPNDVEVYNWGTSYQALHAYRNNPDFLTARGMALRGPVVVSGWGYDTDLKPVPGDGSGGFLANTYKRSDVWPTGPVDHLWDARRGVWTSHDVVIGKVANADIGPNGTGVINVSSYAADTSWQLSVKNWSPSLGAGIGQQVFAAYVFSANAWFVLSHGERTLRGTTAASIGPNASGTVNLTVAGTPSTLTAWNFSASATVGSGKRVVVTKVDRDDKWYIIAADC